MKTIIITFTIIFFSCSTQNNSAPFSLEDINYFTEIALGAEFGDEVPVIKKWEDNIRIKIDGEPTEADLQTLINIVDDLNQLINNVKIKIVNNKENVKITFSPESDFSNIDPNYIPTNYGFFWALWHDDNFIIYNASILVSSVDINQQERSHLIREELTQSLGLMNDSKKYKDSIFYQDWTEIEEYSDIDKTIIGLLYNENIEPGMTKNQVLEQLGKT